MSTTASIDGAEVFSPGTRAIEPVTLRNNSSADCSDSGFAVVLLQNDGHAPEPELQWRVDGGAWHGAGLTWDDGSSSGDGSCASPCWMTGLVRLDVPAHSALTIDIAVLFQSAAGVTSEGFMGNVDYTDETAFPQYVSGPILSWSYDNQAGSGSGGDAPSSRRPSAAVSSRPPVPTHSTAPSPKASPSLSLSPGASPTSADTSTGASSAAATASQTLATVADVRSGGSGMSGVLTLIGVAVLAMAAGGGFLVTRRRRTRQTSDGI